LLPLTKLVASKEEKIFDRQNDFMIIFLSHVGKIRQLIKVAIRNACKRGESVVRSPSLRMEHDAR
jgi:hypothetical protein